MISVYGRVVDVVVIKSCAILRFSSRAMAVQTVSDLHRNKTFGNKTHVWLLPEVDNPLGEVDNPNWTNWELGGSSSSSAKPELEDKKEETTNESKDEKKTEDSEKSENKDSKDGENKETEEEEEEIDTTRPPPEYATYLSMQKTSKSGKKKKKAAKAMAAASGSGLTTAEKPNSGATNVKPESGKKLESGSNSASSSSSSSATAAPNANTVTAENSQHYSSNVNYGPLEITQKGDTTQSAAEPVTKPNPKSTSNSRNDRIEANYNPRNHNNDARGYGNYGNNWNQNQNWHGNHRYNNGGNWRHNSNSWHQHQWGQQGYDGENDARGFQSLESDRVIKHLTKQTLGTVSSSNPTPDLTNPSPQPSPQLPSESPIKQTAPHTTSAAISSSGGYQTSPSEPQHPNNSGLLKTTSIPQSNHSPGLNTSHHSYNSHRSYGSHQSQRSQHSQRSHNQSYGSQQSYGPSNPAQESHTAAYYEWQERFQDTEELPEDHSLGNSTWFRNQQNRGWYHFHPKSLHNASFYDQSNPNSQAYRENQQNGAHPSNLWDEMQAANHSIRLTKEMSVYSSSSPWIETEADFQLLSQHCDPGVRVAREQWQQDITSLVKRSDVKLTKQIPSKGKSRRAKKAAEVGENGGSSSSCSGTIQPEPECFENNEGESIMKDVVVPGSRGYALSSSYWLTREIQAKQHAYYQQWGYPKGWGKGKGKGRSRSTSKGPNDKPKTDSEKKEESKVRKLWRTIFGEKKTYSGHETPPQTMSQLASDASSSNYSSNQGTPDSFVTKLLDQDSNPRVTPVKSPGSGFLESLSGIASATKALFTGGSDSGKKQQERQYMDTSMQSTATVGTTHTGITHSSSSSSSSAATKAAAEFTRVALEARGLATEIKSLSERVNSGRTTPEKLISGTTLSSTPPKPEEQDQGLIMEQEPSPVPKLESPAHMVDSELSLIANNLLTGQPSDLLDTGTNIMNLSLMSQKSELGALASCPGDELQRLSPGQIANWHFRMGMKVSLFSYML